MAGLVDLEGGVVHADALSSDVVFDVEQRAIFRHSWLFLAPESQLVPGSRFATWMGDTPVSVDRSSSGRVRARTAGDALVPVPRVDVVAGLVFGCWDPDAPALGGVLAGSLDELAGAFGSPGADVLGTTHRWVIDANWKACLAPLRTGPAADQVRVRLHDAVRLSGTEWVAAGAPSPSPDAPTDDVRLFPTFSYVPSMRTVRVWHPRSPVRTEVWAWVLIDPSTPTEVRAAVEAFAADVLPAEGRLSLPVGATPGAAAVRLDASTRAFYEQWYAALVQT